MEKSLEKPTEVKKISEHISLFSDGKYRWEYKLNLLKNPTVFFTVWKIFLILLGISFLLAFFFSLGNKDFFFSGFLQLLKGYGIAFGTLTLVTLLGYMIYAAIMGGKYIVEFEMDEIGISHIQNPKQAEKAKKISALTAAAGVAAKRPSAAAAGVNSSLKTVSYTDFSKVKRIKIRRKLCLIKLNEVLERNQIYTEKEDFDFVKNYISERCKNVK